MEETGEDEKEEGEDRTEQRCKLTGDWSEIEKPECFVLWRVLSAACANAVQKVNKTKQPQFVFVFVRVLQSQNIPEKITLFFQSKIFTFCWGHCQLHKIYRLME